MVYTKDPPASGILDALESVDQGLLAVAGVPDRSTPCKDGAHTGRVEPTKVESRQAALGVGQEADGSKGGEALRAHALNVGAEGKCGVPPDAQPAEGVGRGDGGGGGEGDAFGGPTIITDGAPRGVKVKELSLGSLDFEADPAKERVQAVVGSCEGFTIVSNRIPCGC